MVRYFRLLRLHYWYAFTAWFYARFKRCPLCFGLTTPERINVGGGIFSCRLCVRCGGLSSFVNVTPERVPEEEAVSLPF